jgi:hypothetical protein
MSKSTVARRPAEKQPKAPKPFKGKHTPAEQAAWDCLMLMDKLQRLNDDVALLRLAADSVQRSLEDAAAAGRATAGIVESACAPLWKRLDDLDQDSLDHFFAAKALGYRLLEAAKAKSGRAA